MRNIVCLFAALTISAQAENRLMVLVEEGSPRATIVLADRPYLAAKYGAEVLNRYLEAATGATLPVRSAAEVDTLDDDQVWILIGDSPLVRQLGLEADDFPFGFIPRWASALSGWATAGSMMRYGTKISPSGTVGRNGPAT